MHASCGTRQRRTPAPGRGFNGALVEAALLFAGQMPNIKGSEAGHLLRLMPWQKFVFASIFGLVERGTTTRRFRQAVVYVPRGNGKTTIAAPIGLYLTFVEGEGGAEGVCRRGHPRPGQDPVRRGAAHGPALDGVPFHLWRRRGANATYQDKHRENCRQRYFVGATLPMKRASRRDRLQPFCPLTFQGCGSTSYPAS